MSTSTSTNVPLLTTANYLLWADAMEDYLRAKGYWFQIHTPPPTQIADPKGWRKCMELGTLLLEKSNGTSPLS